ncbi:MAG: hypothetical protein ACRCYT_04915 [Cetobacterium sp.]
MKITKLVFNGLNEVANKVVEFDSIEKAFEFDKNLIELNKFEIIHELGNKGITFINDFKEVISICYQINN